MVDLVDGLRLREAKDLCGIAVKSNVAAAFPVIHNAAKILLADNEPGGCYLGTVRACSLTEDLFLQ